MRRAVFAAQRGFSSQMDLNSIIIEMGVYTGFYFFSWETVLFASEGRAIQSP